MDKKEEQKKPIELEDKDIESVAGGVKKSPVTVVGDPCAGGEVYRKH